MKNTLILFSLLFCHFLFSQQIEADYIFTNVSIIPMNKDTVLRNHNIAIKNNKIIEITNAKGNRLKGKNTIDTQGKFVMPALADAHVHLPKEEADVEKFLILNLINGVTKLRSMRGNWKDIEWRKKFNGENTIFPKLYLSPPPIHRSHDITTQQLSDYVNKAEENNFDFIKILSIKNQQLFVQLDSICQKQDLKIAGHFPGNVDDEVVFNSNLTSIEHLGGLIGEKEDFENRLSSIKEKKIYICPTLQWYVIGYGQYSIEYMKSQRGMEYINPDIVADWTEKSIEYRAKKMGISAFEKEVASYAKELEERYGVVKRINDKGIPLLLSPDSSSKFIVPGFGMLEEMRLYREAGVPNYDILKAATINFAHYFDDSYGTIEIGKDADLIFMDENPLEKLEALENIEAIFLNNQFIDKDRLQKLSNAIRPE